MHGVLLNSIVSKLSCHFETVRIYVICQLYHHSRNIVNVHPLWPPKKVLDITAFTIHCYNGLLEVCERRIKLYDARTLAKKIRKLRDQ